MSLSRSFVELEAKRRELRELLFVGLSMIRWTTIPEHWGVSERKFRAFVKHGKYSVFEDFDWDKAFSTLDGVYKAMSSGKMDNTHIEYYKLVRELSKWGLKLRNDIKRLQGREYDS